MASFLLSPGVLTREVDNSQYSTTSATGNVAALVGYAEKGPFEPTLVYSTEEFNKQFGKTLADAPYLAQAAYKYFGQGSALLVTRAGDDRDPDLYPQAAQNSTKSIRLGETDVAATKGYQAFTRANELAAGTFAPGAEFGFKVTADHRAFLEPKTVETWDITLHETSNGMGVATPSGELESVIETGYAKVGDKSFEINYKENNITYSQTVEKSGTGNKTGSSFGDTVSSTVYGYSQDGVFADNRDAYTYFSGTHTAIVLGKNDLKDGYDFDASNEDLTFELDSVSYAVNLDLACVSATEVIAHINNKLQNAVDESTANIVDLSGDMEAFIVTPKVDGTTYIGLKRIAANEENIAGINTVGFEITTCGVATVFGFTPKQYLDADTIFGTYHGETGVATQIFDGNIVLTKNGAAVSSVESFEESIDVEVTAPASGAWALSDIVSQINTTLDAGHDGYPAGTNPARATATIAAASGKVTLTSKQTAGDGYRSIVRIKNNASNSLIDLLGQDLPTDGTQERPVGEAVIILRAVEKGSHGQKLVLRTSTGTQQVSATAVEKYYNVTVLSDGKEVTTYQRVSWTDPTSSQFLPTLLESDLYVNMEAEDEDGDFILEILPDGDWVLGSDELPEGVSTLVANVTDFTVGTDGWTSDSDGIITSMDADLVNGLKQIYNPEVYDFNLVAAPGAASSIVQNAIQALCDSRRDCFGITDAAPFGYGLGVKSGLNHVSEINAMNENLNSSYVGTYWPWLQDYDSDNKQYVWLPPSIYAMTQMVYTDNVADPWYAAAGLSRGKVGALDVEYSPTNSDRDILYGGTNVINPIVKFVGEGMAIWGQKTCQRTSSSLDRINVRRLMIYAEKLIAKMARGFLFEQNDSANWASFARQANAILEPIRQRRGLYTYSVVCDTTTNTSALINQNIMAGKIFVQPTKTIEFIEVDFTINAAGDVSFSE